SATSAASCATATPSATAQQAMVPARMARRAQPRARAISDLPQYKNYTVGQADRQLAVSVPQLAVLSRSHPERPTSAASPAGRKKSAENWSPKSNSAGVAASKLLRTGQGRTIGWSPLRNSSFASPEYRFEFIFERARRNPK